MSSILPMTLICKNQKMSNPKQILLNKTPYLVIEHSFEVSNKIDAELRLI
jgi:hypothetical protein